MVDYKVCLNEICGSYARKNPIKFQLGFKQCPDCGAKLTMEWIAMSMLEDASSTVSETKEDFCICGHNRSWHHRIAAPIKRGKINPEPDVIDGKCNYNFCHCKKYCKDTESVKDHSQETSSTGLEIPANAISSKDVGLEPSPDPNVHSQNSPRVARENVTIKSTPSSEQSRAESGDAKADKNSQISDEIEEEIGKDYEVKR